jgi:predicted ATPase
MELKDLIKSLKQYANSLLDREGWSIIVELHEIESDHIVLKIKDRFQQYFQQKSTKETIYKLNSFEEIFAKKEEISEAIRDEKKLKGVDTYTIFNYKQRILYDIGGVFNRNKELVALYNYALEHNYSYIHSFHVKKFFSIQTIQLDEIKGAKEIYFLGENGDGKSLILMALHLAFNGNYIQHSTSFEFTGKIQQLLKENSEASFYAKDIDGTSYGGEKNIQLKGFCAYGANRGRYSSDTPERYGYMSLYDHNVELYSPEKLLSQLFLFELEKRLDQQNMVGEDKELPNWVPLNDVINLLQTLLENNVEIKVSGGGIRFTEKGYELSFEQLSEGYKNLLIWISDLLYRLQQDQPNIDKIENLKGIVLLDEIELHLHPIWQSKIVAQIRSFFKNVQFIFTTHSPTIIQGASENAVIYRVFRNSSDGKTKVSDPYYKKDLDHLMFNSLVTSPLFGLSNARISKETQSPDTSDSYLQSRINKRIEEELKRQKSEGKEFLSDAEIDSLIDEVLKDELKNDKSK